MKNTRLLMVPAALALMSMSACAAETPNAETVSAPTAEIAETVASVSDTPEAPVAGSQEETVKVAQAGHNAAAPAPANVDFIFTEAPDDHAMGSKTAPVTVIAYASVTCPHCSDWFIREYPTFKTEQIDTGKVRFILREFPTPPQQVALGGFIIADCAPQEKYWDHVIYQFQNQTAIMDQFKNGQAQTVIDQFANMADLKGEGAVDACFNDPSHLQRIQRAVDRAHAGGISGVPAFFMNGTKFTAPTTATNLGAAIDAMSAQGVSRGK